MDVADIESYGSASKIIKKNWKVAALASDMARGFCAWFILQHLRGYKPFITIMEKEQILKLINKKNCIKNKNTKKNIKINTYNQIKNYKNTNYH